MTNTWSTSASPLDDLRCIVCGDEKHKMMMLNVKALEESKNPSLFLAFAMCDICDENQCAREALAALRRIVTAADNNQ